MTRTVTQDHHEDFRYTLMPTWFDQFWGHEAQPTFRRLAQAVKYNCLGQFSIFHGPPGSGKNAAAYILGMVATCDDWDPETHAPCGECPACRHIHTGRSESWMRGAFIEIDGADKESPEAVSDSIREAFSKCQAYGRRISDSGDEDRLAVVLIDEAQRLKPTVRESLLTLIQRWPKAHIIAATTDLGRLQIESDREPTDDPLISRGDLYQFDYPGTEQAALGLCQSARRVGLNLSPAAATRIVTSNGGRPRGCLGDLSKLVPAGPDIDIAQINQFFGVDRGRRSSMAAGHNPNDPLAPRAF